MLVKVDGELLWIDEVGVDTSNLEIEERNESEEMPISPSMNYSILLKIIIYSCDKIKNKK